MTDTKCKHLNMGEFELQWTELPKPIEEVKNSFPDGEAKEWEIKIHALDKTKDFEEQDNLMLEESSLSRIMNEWANKEK